MMISLSDYEMRVKYLKKITKRHLWGQGKPTAHTSTNVNRRSAFRYNPPPLPTAGSRGKQKSAPKVCCGKWKYEPLIYLDPHL
jgi:hypothetical protein